jgi:hypothetical protein
MFQITFNNFDMIINHYKLEQNNHQVKNCTQSKFCNCFQIKNMSNFHKLLSQCIHKDIWTK